MAGASAGGGPSWGSVEELLHETVRHEMLSQYDPDTVYWIKNRAKAFGGWNGGLLWCTFGRGGRLGGSCGRCLRCGSGSFLGVSWKSRACGFFLAPAGAV